MKYQVLLYYFYNPIPDTEATRKEQEDFCTQNQLLGRILIAPEGINGTVSGLLENTRKYMDWMQQHPLFKGISFKSESVENHTFLKLNVRVKEEIVHFGEKHPQPPVVADNYLEPDAWREMLKNNDPDKIILDARSDYEWQLGKFKGAHTLDIHNFRELPEKLAEIEKYKDKKIYTYCTGGIKCEKVSEWLKEKGFENVYQLHGGIIRYGIEAGGEDFEGACYVFDQRVSVPVNSVNPTVISDCAVCNKNKTERYINCASTACNNHIVICDSCLEKFEGCCSQTCFEDPHRRIFDGKGYYLRGINSKLYKDKPDPNYLRLMQEKTEKEKTSGQK